MKLTLIGSSRFADEYDRLNRELSLAGHVVYSIAQVSTSAGQELPADEKMVLDLVHLRKIQESEAVVLVTDEKRYIGFSTRREMIWARMIQRPIYGPVSDDGSETFGDFGPALQWCDMSWLLQPELIRGE